MRVDKKRQTVARYLLVVMLAMLAFSSLHVHESVSADAEECYQCTHHQAHSGHLTAGHFSLHDCVLCQISTTPFIVAAILLFAVLSVRQAAFTDHDYSVPTLKVWDRKLSRAPPVVSM